MEDQGIPRAALSEGVLTIDVDSHVETMEEQEDARWHQLLNAHRTKKILTGQLGGIERLDSGWVVAITYYNGFRILIPMDEMMINLMGDGRENSDTLNRQTRIANNMLGSDIDFIIRDLDEQSRSVVASRKDAMLKKRQMFYLNENEEEKPMLYPGRVVEARVIAVAPKVVRLEAVSYTHLDVYKRQVLEKGQIYAYFEKDGRERFVGRALKTLEKDRMIYTNNETKQDVYKRQIYCRQSGAI